MQICWKTICRSTISFVHYHQPGYGFSQWIQLLFIETKCLISDLSFLKKNCNKTLLDWCATNFPKCHKNLLVHPVPYNLKLSFMLSMVIKLLDFSEYIVAQMIQLYINLRVVSLNPTQTTQPPTHKGYTHT